MNRNQTNTLGPHDRPNDTPTQEFSFSNAFYNAMVITILLALGIGLSIALIAMQISVGIMMMNWLNHVGPVVFEEIKYLVADEGKWICLAAFIAATFLIVQFSITVLFISRREDHKRLRNSHLAALGILYGLSCVFYVTSEIIYTAIRVILDGGLVAGWPAVTTTVFLIGLSLLVFYRFVLHCSAKDNSHAVEDYDVIAITFTLSMIPIMLASAFTLSVLL